MLKSFQVYAIPVKIIDNFDIFWFRRKLTFFKKLFGVYLFKGNTVNINILNKKINIGIIYIKKIIIFIE